MKILISSVLYNKNNLILKFTLFFLILLMTGMSLTNYLGNTGYMRGGIITAIICFYLLLLVVDKFKCKKIPTIWLVILIFVAIVIPRLILILNTNVQPYSDFATTLDAAEKLVKHDYSSIQSMKLVARFPNLVPWIVFESIIVKLFPGNPIQALGVLNCIGCGVIGVTIFLLGKKLSVKTGLLASAFYALYPSSIVFCTVLSCQHFSTACDYLAFILILLPNKNFLKNKKNIINAFTVGGILGISQLFRPDALPIVIAILIYIINSCFRKVNCKANWKIELLRVFVIVVSFFIINNTAFWILQKQNIIPDASKRTDIGYKLFIGLNFNQGIHSSEDYNNYFSANSTERQQLLFSRIVEYGKHPLRLIELFYRKYFIMWAYNSSSFSWQQGKEISELRTKIDDDTISAWEMNKYNRLMNYQSIFISLDSGYYFLITFFAAVAAWCLRKQNPENDLFSLLTWVSICYIGVFFFIEVQERYKYFLMPAMIIFAAYGVTVYDNFFNRVRRLLNNQEHQDVGL